MTLLHGLSSWSNYTDRAKYNMLGSMIMYTIKVWMKLTFNNTPWILSPPHFLAGNFNDCVAAHYSKGYACLEFAVLFLKFLVLITVTVGELVDLQTHIIIVFVAVAAAILYELTYVRTCVCAHACMSFIVEYWLECSPLLNLCCTNYTNCLVIIFICVCVFALFLSFTCASLKTKLWAVG
jgi:hypothetical protein